MKLSVCTDLVFSGLPTQEAAKRVLALGMDTIEFWGWWDKDIDGIAALQQETGLKVAALCTRFISLVDPACRQDYVAALRETVETAKKLNCSVIISQTGADRGIDRAEQLRSMETGLKECAPILEDAGMTLTVEPLNLRVNHAGYFLSSSDECAELLDAVDSRNVRMLYDIYHQQITEGDVIRRIQQYIDLIGHFHSAGNPGRNELYRGELNYAEVFRAIRETGYDRFVGLEYAPTENVEKGLKYAKSIAED